MLFILSLFPIALILFLMLGLRWGAARAGGAGYLITLPIAALAFGAGGELLAFAHAKAFFLSVDVLLIIWAAFLFYRVADEAGAIRIIGEALPNLTADRGMQALLIGWVFASFLQGVGGFGVPVAVISPILVSLGFPPLQAVVIPSLGHGWAVTFGSLGSSFQALMAATDLPAETLAPPAALFLGVAGVITGWMTAHAAGGWQALRRLFFVAAILGLVMGAAQYVVAAAGFWNIAAFAGGLSGLAVSFPLARAFHSGRPPITGQPNANPLNARLLLMALSGYILLVIITLGIQLIAPLKEFLGQVVVQAEFPELRTALGWVTPAGPGRKLPIFRHAGAILTYASIAAFLIYRAAGRYPPGALRRITAGTLQRVMPASVSIASMVAMAVVMEHSGMTDTLARGLADIAGAAFPVIAPWIGAVGAFMTGSNTNSNVVFGGLQLRTATLLAYPPALILAAQTAGAALASVIAPSKVAVGASTAGMAGREGEIMRRLLGYTVILLLLIGVLTLLGLASGGR